MDFNICKVVCPEQSPSCMGPEQDGLFLIETRPYLVLSDHSTISPLSQSDGISLPVAFSVYCCSPSVCWFTPVPLSTPVISALCQLALGFVKRGGSKGGENKSSPRISPHLLFSCLFLSLISFHPSDEMNADEGRRGKWYIIFLIFFSFSAHQTLPTPLYPNSHF